MNWVLEEFGCERITYEAMTAVQATLAADAVEMMGPSAPSALTEQVDSDGWFSRSCVHVAFQQFLGKELVDWPRPPLRPRDIDVFIIGPQRSNMMRGHWTVALKQPDGRFTVKDTDQDERDFGTYKELLTFIELNTIFVLE